jgi:UDP-N-acetylmuramate dehydrogenase
LRCAGSVFKNPPGGPPAGRLLEEAELKGRRVGGAWVTTAHANVIAVEGDAVASDVVALMEIARLAVVLRFGISLEPEVIIP